MIKLLKKSLTLLLLTLLFLQPLANTSIAILPSTEDPLKQLTDTFSSIKKSKEKLLLTDCYFRCFDPSSEAIIRKKLPYLRGKDIQKELKDYLISKATMKYVTYGIDRGFTQIGRALSKHGDLRKNPTNRIFGFFYHHLNTNVRLNAVTFVVDTNKVASNLLTKLFDDPDSLWCANSISDADTGAEIQLLEIWSKEAFIADEGSKESETAKQTRRDEAYAIRFYVQGKMAGHLRGVIEYVDEKKAKDQISAIAKNQAEYQAKLEDQRKKAREKKQALEEFQADTSSVSSVQKHFDKSTLKALEEQLQLAPPVLSSDSTTTNRKKLCKRISEIDEAIKKLRSDKDEACKTLKLNKSSSNEVFNNLLKYVIFEELHKKISESIALKWIYINHIDDKDVVYKNRLLDDIRRDKKNESDLLNKIDSFFKNAIRHIIMTIGSSTDYSAEFITEKLGMFKDRVQELENKLRELILSIIPHEKILEQSKEQILKQILEQSQPE